MAQRPIGEPLHRIADQHAHGNRDAGADQHDGERRQTGGDERVDHGEGHHGADHHHFAVREVDELDDAVDHGVAERHHGVDASRGKAVDDLLEKRIHGRQA